MRTGEVKENTNLVVRAGIKQFPWPDLKYGCGMGKCAKCASRILAGAEHLPPPNWKEQKLLGPHLEAGWRLACQLWISHDLELTQDGAPTPQPVRASALAPSRPGEAGEGAMPPAAASPSAAVAAPAESPDSGGPAADAATAAPAATAAKTAASVPATTPAPDTGASAARPGDSGCT